MNTSQRNSVKPTLTLLTALLLVPLIVLNAEDIAPLKQARASDPTTAFDWKGLNTQAAEECLTPVHPGMPGQTPFWNVYATQFTYAPAFDFPEVARARVIASKPPT